MGKASSKTLKWGAFSNKKTFSNHSRNYSHVVAMKTA